MKNKDYPLRSSMDELSTKNDNEIDLEKGPLPEYNSEDGGTLPPYSDISKLANPVPEDSSTGPTETTNPNVERRQEFKDSHPNIYSLLRLLISVLAVSVVFFTAWVCVNPLEKSIFGKVAFSVTIGITCPIVFIAIFCFFETWTQAVAQCIKVTAISLAKCVKVISIGLFNIRREMMIIIWILWLIICCILFGCVKDGRLNLNKALICSTSSISAALFFILLLVCIPIWTLKHMLFGLFQVLGVQSCVVIVTKGLMYLFDKHIDATGYEIEASSLFVIGNFLFFYEMERPGALKRMPKFIGNGIASFLGGLGNAFGGIGNAIGRIGNAFRGANDNNDIPLGEMDVESEV
uniref:Cw19 n=1 Tax=Schizosaccharomyces pombe TaxID=4896 RepID=A0A1X9Q9G6_SCHPM|nr:cw19 [Schizosaccharomyces pombe]